MNKSLLLRLIVFLTVIFFFMGIGNPPVTISQQTPTLSETPQIKEKPHTNTGGEKLPKLLLENTEHDLGTVYEGTVVTHSFIVQNKGKADLLINQVKPGWGCSVASFDKVIPPGQEGKITLSIKTDNMSGKFNKSANISSNDPTLPSMRIKLSGEIKHYISVTPSPRLYLTGFEGEVVSKSIKIINNEDSPLKITRIASDIDDKIKHELKTIAEGTEYELSVQTLEGLQGVSRGIITLTTNSEKKPKIEIRVSINLKDDLTISPTALYFGNISLTSQTEKSSPPLNLTKYITVNKVKGNPVKIEKIIPSSKLIHTKMETKEEGKKYVIAVSLEKDKLKAGLPIDESVEIHTSDKKKPVIQVTIKGNVI